jgi:hypothetical protein
MKKVLTVFLTAIVASASLAAGAEIRDLAWDESNIKTLRAFNKAAVLRFENEINPAWAEQSESDFHSYEYHWYPAGGGKYELAISSQTGPDLAVLTIYRQDAPGKIRSQEFDSVGDASEAWYDGPGFTDLNGDGKDELISLEPFDNSDNLAERKFIPNGFWLKVYRLRDGEYVEASRDFPGFYENQVLPQLEKAISKAQQDVKKVAAEKDNPPSGVGPNDDHWQEPARLLAALIMCRDKILRVIGRDPTAGLAQARAWMTSPDPALVDDARIVLQDMGGHDKEVRSANLATTQALKNWPSKTW